MAMTYEEATRRLGRRAVVQIDKRRGTEFRRAPGEAGLRGDIQVRYRGIPVVTFHPNHTYTLRTGGMASKTVIKRIAEYSPISLVRRGNGFFIEDVNRGKLIPFLEGQCVDATGAILDDTGGGMVLNRGQRDEASGGEAGGPPLSPSSHMLDEAKLRAFIKRAVLEVMSDAVMPPLSQTRPVHVQSTTREREAPVAGAPENAAAAELLEQLLDGKIAPEKARKKLRELKGAFNRGRTRADDFDRHEGVDDEDLDRVAIGVVCDKCSEPMAMHFDKANRYRGCDYALDHRGEKVELIR